MADYKSKKPILPSIVSLRNKEKDGFNIGAFNGNVQVSVWQSGNTGKGPVVKFTLPFSGALLLKKIGRKLSGLGPGHAISFMKQGYDRENKKFFPEVTITLGKDEKSIYYLEVTSSNIQGNTLRFPIWGGKSMIVTDENGTQMDGNEQLSENAFTSFIESLDRGYYDLVFASYQDSKFYELNNGGSNASGNTSRTTTNSNSSDDDDDIPF